MTSTIQMIQVKDIAAGDNDRKQFDPDALETLARSIDQTGLTQPITVRPVGERYEIVAGERRFRAMSSLLGWTEVPALVRTMDDADASAVMLSENMARVDLNVIEEAEAYQKRIDVGATVEEIALQAGVKEWRVRWRLELLNLCPEGRHLAATGQLSNGVAQDLSRLDSDRQVAVLRAMGANDMRPTEIKDMIRMMHAAMVEQQSMFNSEDFMQMEVWVEKARQYRVGKATLADLVRRLVEQVDVDGMSDELASIVGEARTALGNMDDAK